MLMSCDGGWGGVPVERRRGVRRGSVPLDPDDGDVVGMVPPLHPTPPCTDHDYVVIYAEGVCVDSSRDCVAQEGLPANSDLTIVDRVTILVMHVRVCMREVGGL